MKPINIAEVQAQFDKFINKTVYVHLETTTGMYASLMDKDAFTVGAFIRNAEVKFTNAKIVQSGNAYRAGLKMEMGWVYAEGLTDWTLHEDQLLLAGHDHEGRLLVALEISERPFRY
ncbi:YojF family protein [Oceanobacillus sp. FSL H7-0719]|uniref:YojF family protein n=1 Tax=Oceanobacillus sp. FSL H7-0719 TaxID=2954507 RepID=UPI00324B1ECA